MTAMISSAGGPCRQPVTVVMLGICRSRISGAPISSFGTGRNLSRVPRHKLLTHTPLDLGRTHRLFDDGSVRRWTAVSAFTSSGASARRFGLVLSVVKHGPYDPPLTAAHSRLNSTLVSGRSATTAPRRRAARRRAVCPSGSYVLAREGSSEAAVGKPSSAGSCVRRFLHQRFLHQRFL